MVERRWGWLVAAVIGFLAVLWSVAPPPEGLTVELAIPFVLAGGFFGLAVVPWLLICAFSVLVWLIDLLRGRRRREPDPSQGEADVRRWRAFGSNLVVCGSAACAGWLYAASVPGWYVGLALLSLTVEAFAAVAWATWVTRLFEPDWRRPSRREALARVAPLPAIVALTWGLTVAGTPLIVRFDVSRPALEEAVTRAEADDGLGPRWIGLMPNVEVESWGTCVRFHVRGAGFWFGDALEFCHSYSRDGAPPRSTQIADGWWVVDD